MFQYENWLKGVEKDMKKVAFILCILGILLVQFGMAPTYAAEMDVLINKLVEKGILTHPEAGKLLKEMQEEGNRQEATVREVATEVARETATKTAKEEAKSNLAKLPKWVDKIKLKGDFRLRYQYQDKKTDSGEKTDRKRGRYRWRFGAIADVTEDCQVGFGLASGSGDPRSTNQTFANDFETPDARIDYAYAQYKPFKWLKLVGGQMKNPLYRVKDLMWDSDIRPQGVATPVKYHWNDSDYFFVTPALFILDEYKADDKSDPYMFVLQPGIKMNINKSFWFKVAGSWYLNTNVDGTNFKYSSGTNTTDINGNLIYDYSALAIGGEFGFKFGGPVPRLIFFGQFVKSDADDNEKGWLAGVKFGHKVKKFPDWEMSYNYRKLEKDAWPDFLPDSDFYGGKTNAKGHEVAFKLGLAKHVDFAIDYYYTEKIDYAPGLTSEPENLVQVDLKFKW